MPGIGGSGYDLSIAVAILAAAGVVPAALLAQTMFLRWRRIGSFDLLVGVGHRRYHLLHEFRRFATGGQHRG
jgi:hypothetical protein